MILYYERCPEVEELNDKNSIKSHYTNDPTILINSLRIYPLIWFPLPTTKNTSYKIQQNQSDINQAAYQTGCPFIYISKMFKQLKNSTHLIKQSEDSSQPPSLSKTQKLNHNILPKQLLQFLARQITILKDIASRCHQIHPDIVSNHLQQCTHLIEKKISYSLGDNPELYHDYIQDFYESQLKELRSELNICKIDLMARRKQLQQIKTSYEILSREKQTRIENLQSSRISKNSIEHIEQNSKYKKQLDHCRILLVENNSLIQEQAKAIQSLSVEIKVKQKEHYSLRQKYDKKIIQFDTQVNKHNSQMEALIKNLTLEHKNYQSNLKQLTFIKIRTLQEKMNLEKQLEMKVEEIQLLTKRIFEDQIIIGKLQRTTVLKEKLIQELYQEIDNVNGSLSRVGKKQEVFQKTYVEKNEEIGKLEQRIRLVNEANEKLQKKNIILSRKIEQLQQQVNQILQQLRQQTEKLDKANLENESNLRKVQISQKNQTKLLREKQRYVQEIKILEQRYQDLFQRSKQEKQTVKKEIMTEVNELIALVQQKENELISTKGEKDQLNKELCRERQSRSDVQHNYEQINMLMTEMQRKMDILQNENSIVNEAKLLMQIQLDKLSKQLNKLSGVERKYQQLMAQKSIISQSLQEIRSKQMQMTGSQKSINEGLQKRENQLSQNFSSERKQYKQMINKKDFHIKQLESKIKILQQQIRESSKLFDNEKFKMGSKIKQLEQLLKERYDFSSRFSHHSENAI